MLNEEPVHERDRMIVAMLKPLGIEKGKPFQSDACQKKILEEAAVVGEAMASSLSYAKRQEEALMYPGRQWKNAILLEADQETAHYTSLDERTAWFYEAVTLSAGMTTKAPGKGQVYLGVQKDKDGEWLQGGNNYTLRVPANPPAANFWSVTLYEAENASSLANGQPFPSLGSRDNRPETPTAAPNSTWGPTPRRAKRRTGSPRCPGKGTSPFCGSTGRPSRRSRRPGNPATLRR